MWASIYRIKKYQLSCLPHSNWHNTLTESVIQLIYLSGGRIFFSRVNFLCWLLIRYPFHPRVTAVARKRARSFCQMCRWQVTAKHAYTLHMWLCMKWHGAWLYGVHRTRQDGSSFMWHQPCQRCKYTTLVDIQKRTIKSYTVTHVESHVSTVSLLESGEQCYINAINNNNSDKVMPQATQRKEACLL